MSEDGNLYIIFIT